MKLLPSALNPPVGSLIVPDSTKARHPVDASPRKFLSLNNGSPKPMVSFWRAGYNSKRYISQLGCAAQSKLLTSGSDICRNKLHVCQNSRMHQKTLDGSMFNEEDILKLMAEDMFSLYHKVSWMIDPKAKPARDTADRSTYIANGYHAGSSSSIHNSIFHKGTEMGKHYEKMIGEDPSNPLLWRNYALYLYLFKGNLVAAEDCYLFALRLDPENSQYMVEYALLAWELHHSEWITEYYFEKAIKSSPDDLFVHAAYARFLYQIEDDEELKIDH